MDTSFGCTSFSSNLWVIPTCIAAGEVKSSGLCTGERSCSQETRTISSNPRFCSLLRGGRSKKNDQGSVALNRNYFCQFLYKLPKSFLAAVWMIGTMPFGYLKSILKSISSSKFLHSQIQLYKYKNTMQNYKSLNWINLEKYFHSEILAFPKKLVDNGLRISFSHFLSFIILYPWPP